MSTDYWFGCCIEEPRESRLLRTKENVIFQPDGSVDSIQTSATMKTANTAPRFIPLGFKYSIRTPLDQTKSEMNEKDGGWLGVSGTDSSHVAYINLKVCAEDSNCDRLSEQRIVPINESRNCSETNERSDATFTWHNDNQSALKFWEHQENLDQTKTSSVRSPGNGWA
jgi:hypothetical protein